MELESAKTELSNAQATLLRAAAVVESQEITSAQRTLPRLVDSALLLALGGALAWVGGFFYYDGFYRRLGLSVYSLSMESPNRLFLPFIPFVLLAACLLFVSYVFYEAVGPTGFVHHPRVTAWIYNTPMWSIAGGFLVLELVRGDSTWPRNGNILASALLLCLWASIRKVNLFDYSKIRSFPVMITPFIVVVAVISSASETGSLSAERAIEGESPTFPIVELTMRNTNSLLDSRPFVLIEIIDNQYYVVEVAEPAPESPRLHIVPESEIESVSTILEVDQLSPTSPSATPIP